MKVVAIIVALCGVLGFLSFPVGILSSGSSPWPLLLADSVFGAFLIWIAVGIWKRRMAAWRYGFVAIVLIAVTFVVQVCFELPAVSTVQKIVIIISCLVGGIPVAAYWSFVWYRQKKWFSHENVA
jgi:hypothetical protein